MAGNDEQELKDPHLDDELVRMAAAIWREYQIELTGGYAPHPGMWEVRLLAWKRAGGFDSNFPFVGVALRAARAARAASRKGQD